MILLIAILGIAASGCGGEPDSLAYEDELRGWGGETIERDDLREGATTTAPTTTAPATTQPTPEPDTVPDIVVVATTAAPEPVTDFSGTLIFRQNRSGSAGDLFALSLATLQTRQLTNVQEGEEVTDAALSPDGSFVAYFVETDDDFGLLHLLDLEHGTTTQLTDFRSSFWKMSWSADGSKIFFNANQLGRDGLRLFVLDVDDGGSTLLTGPLGSRINMAGSGPGALVYSQSGDEGDLFVHVDPDTLEILSTTASPRYVQTQFSSNALTAYGQWKDDAGPGEVDALRVTSTGFETETISEDAMHATLNASPDGPSHWRVVDDTLLLGSAGGAPSMPLTESPEESNYDVHWMPDSAGVVFSVSTATENSRQFHAWTPDGWVTNLDNFGYVIGVTPMERVG